MAGAEINDAPVLAQAQIGIAIGTSTDMAMESAGVTLVRCDLRGIARVRRLSRATMRNIRQNPFLAFVYNALSVSVAAGVLYPLFGLLVSPIWASAAMSSFASQLSGPRSDCGGCGCSPRAGQTANLWLRMSDAFQHATRAGPSSDLLDTR
jgi:hypothetical protein